MNERKQAPAPKKAATGVPDVNKKVATADSSLYTVEGKANRNVSERTLRKRLARLASSRLVMLLALFVSFSAILTMFRGYFLPITVVLTVERVLLSVGLWMLFATAGKKGGKLLAAIPLAMMIIASIGLAALAGFATLAMFGKVVPIATKEVIQLARLMYASQLWTLVPILACVMAGYCLNLFYRHQRLLLCNLRDGLKYGFAFENGYKPFASGCVIVAAVALGSQFLRLFFTSFSAFGFLSDKAVAMLDAFFLKQMNYGLSLAGMMVQAAVLIVAAVLALRYGAVVKKFKAQRHTAETAKRSAEESKAEVVAIETEKAARRAEKAAEQATASKAATTAKK